VKYFVKLSQPFDERDEVTTVSPGVVVSSSPVGRKVINDTQDNVASVEPPVQSTPSNVPKTDPSDSSKVPTTNTALASQTTSGGKGSGGKVTTASFNKLGNILKNLIPKRVSMTPGAISKTPGAMEKAVKSEKEMYALGVDYFKNKLNLRTAWEIPTYLRNKNPEEAFQAIVKAHPIETRNLEVPTFIRNMIR
tara:strand:+ start:1568 stop:2146 length:579 start_codon:yes stop_codon:yes gene_type:complete